MGSSPGPGPGLSRIDTEVHKMIEKDSLLGNKRIHDVDLLDATTQKSRLG